MTQEDFKARVSMAYEGREQWEAFLNRVWSIHTSELPHWISVEDERIRKDIISYLRNEKIVKRYISDIEIDKWIAWLEKQGFSKEQTNLPCFTFDDVLALECCMETVKKVQEDEELYGKLNDLHSKVYDAYQLEKQGEMKSTEDTKKLDADKVIA